MNIHWWNILRLVTDFREVDFLQEAAQIVSSPERLDGSVALKGKGE